MYPDWWHSPRISEKAYYRTGELNFLQTCYIIPSLLQADDIMLKRREEKLWIHWCQGKV